MLWALYSLLSGFFFATSDAAAKKIKLKDDYIIAWSRLFFSFPIILISIFFTSIPNLDTTFWASLLFNIPLEILAMVLYIKAIRISPLSLTLPFLSLTPVFLIIASYLFLQEFPTIFGIIGICLVAIGTYILNLDKSSGGFLKPFKAAISERGSLLMILVAFVFSITSNLVKVAILHSNTLFYFVFSTILLILALTILFFGRIKKKFNLIKSDLKLLSLNGIFYGFSLLFHMLAVILVIVPYMVSIKRTSSIFGVLYGHFLFREKNIAQRLVGAVIMLSGAVLILLA